MAHVPYALWAASLARRRLLLWGDPHQLGPVWVQRRRVRMEELAFRVESINSALQDQLKALYLPPPPRERPGVKEATALVGRFVEATSGMSMAEITAASGIPVPTVRRLCSGTQPTVQGRTKERILAYLDRVAAETLRAAA